MEEKRGRGSWSWETSNLRPTISYDNSEVEEETDQVTEVLPALGLNPSSQSGRFFLQSKPENTSPINTEKEELLLAAVASKTVQLKELTMVVREDLLELRQAASDLQEYSNAKIARLTLYLGMLAERAHRLDQVAVNCEDKLALAKKEKKRFFNELVAIKGNTRVLLRVRQQGAIETSIFYSILDPYTISIRTSPSKMGAIKEFHFDQVYGPHVGQGGLFQGLQSLMQSALDGYNVCICACGPKGSGKTYTMEGPSHDRGVYFRAYEELFDLSNTEISSSSKYLFGITMLEIQNEQIRDLLLTQSSSEFDTLGSYQMLDYFGEVLQIRQLEVDNPTKFARVVKMGTQRKDKANETRENSSFHIVVTIHIYFSNAITGEKYEGKLSMVDMAGEEIIPNGVVQKATSLSASQFLLMLMNVFNTRRSEKEYVPYYGSKVAQLLSNFLGDDPKYVIILNLSLSEEHIKETLSYLSIVESYGNTESNAGSTSLLKRWKDMLLPDKNEKLLGHLTREKIEPLDVTKGISHLNLSGSFRTGTVRKASVNGPQYSHTKLNSDPLETPGTMALTIADIERTRTTPAGEYLTRALVDFDPDGYDGPASIADAANKLLMLVLAAIIRAGAAREHDMLAEIRESVFGFIRKMENRRVLDTLLVSRVRILYVRSLICQSSELQSIKVPPVERFLEKAGSGYGRTSSIGSSPSKSPVSSQHNIQKDLLDEDFQAFKVHVKSEKKSKLVSIFLKIRGIDEDTWRQHLEDVNLKETHEEARRFAIGKKKVAALFVHTPAGELQQQMREWVIENFSSVYAAGGHRNDGISGHLEALSAAITDGWMTGLGIPTHGSTDALGQLYSEYTKRVYLSQVQRLKEFASTLATEEAETLEQIVKLRCGLESIEEKRRKVMQLIRTDVALLSKEDGGSPFRTPSTASEDARVASLISLEDITRQAEEIQKEASQIATSPSKHTSFLGRLDALSERMPSLLSIDHPCAQKFLTKARNMIESIPQHSEDSQNSRAWKSDKNVVPSESASASGKWRDTSFGTDEDLIHWSVLQFNVGAAMPLIIKCGATSTLELVVKAQARVDNKGGKEVVSVVPYPAALGRLSLHEIKELLRHLPEAFLQLALSRTAEGTRARYARLYRTLALRVPALNSLTLDADTDFKDAES